MTSWKFHLNLQGAFLSPVGTYFLLRQIFILQFIGFRTLRFFGLRIFLIGTTTDACLPAVEQDCRTQQARPTKLYLRTHQALLEAFAR